MMDTTGFGRLSCDAEADSSRKHILQVGSWFEFQSPPKFTAPTDVTVNHVGGHVAVHLPSCIMAAE